VLEFLLSWLINASYSFSMLQIVLSFKFFMFSFLLHSTLKLPKSVFQNTKSDCPVFSALSNLIINNLLSVSVDIVNGDTFGCHILLGSIIVEVSLDYPLMS
jgi:hypothetical protein